MIERCSTTTTMYGMSGARARDRRKPDTAIIFSLTCFGMLHLISVAVVLAGYAAAQPPLPPPCRPFSTAGGKPVECSLTLNAGYTYVIYTNCTQERARRWVGCFPLSACLLIFACQVKGDTQLTLRDVKGVDVAFNECVSRAQELLDSRSSFETAQRTATLASAPANACLCAAYSPLRSGFPFCPGDASASLLEFYMEARSLRRGAHERRNTRCSLGWTRWSAHAAACCFSASAGSMCLSLSAV